MIIKELRIRNFRSIVKADISLTELNIFAGLNDVGKSNVLKALNLFFNHQTDIQTPYDFYQDYSKYTPFRDRKAKEIIIELVIVPPLNYRGGKEVLWKRVWRKDGFQRDKEEILFIDGTKFPHRSKLSAWLENIRFTYIPAIRGNTFFQSLLAQLHDTLAETIEEQLKEAGEGFIKKIKANTKSITANIDKRLGITSEIQLPNNLQNLFRTLDFLTIQGQFNVSLSNRGDGIKTRHIPVILKFIAEQSNIKRAKGSPRVNTIWGYEEPENNLEMSKVFDLANEFLDYSSGIQILTTTHSPGFYQLKNKQPASINLFKVIKPNDKEASIELITDGTSSLDGEIGLLPLISPIIEEKTNLIKHLQNERDLIKQELSIHKRNILFVEGESDKILLDKALELLNLQEKILIKAGGGCDWVREQCLAYLYLDTPYKAMGLFDKDGAGEKSHGELVSSEDYKELAGKRNIRGLKLEPPSHVIEIYRKEIAVPVELEEMIPVKFWLELGSSWFEQRANMSELVRLTDNDTTINQALSSKGLSSDEILFVTKAIRDSKKKDFALRIISKPDPELNEALSPLLTFIKNKIEPFLG